MLRNISRQTLLKNAGTIALLSFLAASAVIPLLWMLFTSFKPLQEIENGALLPKSLHPENYSAVFRQVPFARYCMNSVFVAAWVTFLSCFTSAMGAYAFARLDWKGRDSVFKLYLGTLMVPGVVTMIPNYTLMVQFHLMDSFTGLIIPSAFGAFGTFLLRQYMLGIPRALDEAAEMDGASHWSIFLDVVLPLSKPGLMALAILTFLGSYGSFYWPLILIKSESLRTLPVGMMVFDSIYGRETNLLMAASLMSLVPPILLFLFGQKHLIRGIILGSVKG